MAKPYTDVDADSVKRQVLSRLERAYGRWQEAQPPSHHCARRLLALWSHAQRFELSAGESKLVRHTARRLRQEQAIMQSYLSQPMSLANVCRNLHQRRRPRLEASLPCATLLGVFSMWDDEALATYAVRRHINSLVFANALRRRRQEVARLESLMHDNIERFARIGNHVNSLLYAYRDLTVMPPDLSLITEKFVLISVAFESCPNADSQARE